jgi:hypothetical protein
MMLKSLSATPVGFFAPISHFCKEEGDMFIYAAKTDWEALQRSLMDLICLAV